MSTIEKIVAELQDSLAKAEAATKGKWFSIPCPTYRCGKDAPWENFSEIAYAGAENAIHIAVAHNNGPRHAQMLLAAIHEAQRWEDYNRSGYPILRAIQEADE